MHIITAHSPDIALSHGLHDIVLKGSTGNSRNGPVLRFPTPVTTVWKTPQRRVSFSPIRDANPFFHLMEAMWMLAGRNDVKMPSMYARQLATYSDDGQTLNGAYGYRWRNYFGYDQLDAVIAELKKNPESRRCVVSMWNGMNTKEEVETGIGNMPEVKPSDLLNQTSKDLPCLAGDTVLRSPEGKNTMKQLAKMFKSGKLTKYPIYATDFSSDGWPVTIQYATNVWSSGKKQTYKITFDDGSSVRATEDHRFFVKKYQFDGSRKVGVDYAEVEVKNLRVGDYMCAGYFRQDTKGYTLRKLRLKDNAAFKNLVREHRDYHEFKTGDVLTKEWTVHHRNEVVDDNRWDNLEKVLTAEHNSHHQRENNRHLAMSSAEVAARGQVHAASMAARRARILRDFGEETLKALNRKGHKRTTKDLGLIKKFYKAEKARKAAEAAERQRRGAEKRYEGIVRGTNAKKGTQVRNRIVSIEKAGVEEVFDFTVPTYHNAMLDNGVVTHNCNLQCLFDLHNGKLNMTVTNRSNDMIWGAYGANIVHFAFLQEYMADQIGVDVGTYYQVSNNMHVYLDFEITARFLEKGQQLKTTRDGRMLHLPTKVVFSNGESDYTSSTNPMPLGSDHPMFREELEKILEHETQANSPDFWRLHQYQTPFFHYVVDPMKTAYIMHKMGTTALAIEHLETAISVAQRDLNNKIDWLYAGLLWLQRRVK